MMMLQHIGQGDVAKRVPTRGSRRSSPASTRATSAPRSRATALASTMEFAKAVVANLGKAPEALAEKRIEAAKKPLSIPDAPAPPRAEAVVGVDVFVHFSERDANALAERVQACNGGGLELAAISNRGVKVWPNGLPETFCTDHYACRFRATDGTVRPQADHRAARPLRRRRPRLHQDRAPLHVRRRALVLARPGRLTRLGAGRLTTRSSSRPTRRRSRSAPR